MKVTKLTVKKNTAIYRERIWKYSRCMVMDQSALGSFRRKNTIALYRIPASASHLIWQQEVSGQQERRTARVFYWEPGTPGQTSRCETCFQIISSITGVIVIRLRSCCEKHCCVIALTSKKTFYRLFITNTTVTHSIIDYYQYKQYIFSFLFISLLLNCLVGFSRS